MHEVLVTSDQHLGYDNSNAIEFSRFLDYIYSRKDDIGSFVILGDFVDMWKRDVSGLFLEHFNIINKLSALRSTGITIYFITGDHDYHLLKLKDHSYPFEFLPYLILPSATTSNLKYNFKHGWEFDLEQHPIIMEALCHNMSDAAGNARSSIYNILQIAKDQFDKNLKEIINFHGGIEGYVEHFGTSTEERLKQFLTDVERRAHSAVRDGEILIFGHTHRPFVSIDRKLVNAGSWVNNAGINNTFVSLEGKEIKLFQFRDYTITDITNIVTGTLEQTLTSLTNNLNMFDNISGQFHSLTGETVSQPLQTRVNSVVREENLQVSPVEFARTTTIKITKGNEIVGTIHEDNFGQLDPKSHKYVKALEESMLKNFELWTEAYPHKSESPDPIANARIVAQLKNIANEMCKDFSGIIEFMKRVSEIDLSDHYIYVKDICQNLGRE